VKKKDFNKLLEDFRVDYEIGDLLGIIVETDSETERVKQIVNAKFKLDRFPENIWIKINTARHVPDEG